MRRNTMNVRRRGRNVFELSLISDCQKQLVSLHDFLVSSETSWSTLLEDELSRCRQTAACRFYPSCGSGTVTMSQFPLWRSAIILTSQDKLCHIYLLYYAIQFVSELTCCNGTLDSCSAAQPERSISPAARFLLRPFSFCLVVAVVSLEILEPWIATLCSFHLLTTQFKLYSCFVLRDHHLSWRCVWNFPEDTLTNRWALSNCARPCLDFVAGPALRPNTESTTQPKAHEQALQEKSTFTANEPHTFYHSPVTFFPHCVSRC